MNKKLLFASLLLTIAFVLLMIAPFAMAMNITCFHNKKIVYKGYGTDLFYGDDFVAFTENKSRRLVLIAADCIVEGTKPQGEPVYAITTGKEEYRPQHNRNGKSGLQT